MNTSFSGCGSGTFSCQNSTNSTCIDPDLVCDRVCDCDNCEDEIKCYGYIPPGRPQKQSKNASYIIIMLQNNLVLIRFIPLKINATILRATWPIAAELHTLVS